MEVEEFFKSSQKQELVASALDVFCNYQNWRIRQDDSMDNIQITEFGEYQVSIILRNDSFFAWITNDKLLKFAKLLKDSNVSMTISVNFMTKEVTIELDMY